MSRLDNHMAEILIKAIDNTHPDPIKNLRGCYKAGDPVAVFDDGHAWGKEEGPPKFFILKLPGVPAAQVRHLIQPLVDANQTLLRRRRFALPNTIVSAAATSGTLTLTLTSLSQQLLDRSLG